MIEDFFDHKCDIFHLKNTEYSPGYGLKASADYRYSDKPDEKGVICHFGVESLETSVTQKNPMNILVEKIKLTLPVDTDIRINDKVVACGTGFEYTAGRPKNIRDHHIFVYIKRTKPQEAI